VLQAETSKRDMVLSASRHSVGCAYGLRMCQCCPAVIVTT